MAAEIEAAVVAAMEVAVATGGITGMAVAVAAIEAIREMEDMVVAIEGTDGNPLVHACSSPKP